MTDYLVVGKKGNGKSLVCVGRIRDALLQGRRVATNLDLVMERLLPGSNRDARCIRLPDRPSRSDLDALGVGNPEPWNEDANGLLVLDEMGSWLNARSWNDRARQPFLEWVIHSRKLGWDCYFIAQGAAQVDKQLRESLLDMQVVCRRLDRIKIPVLGIRLPRVHVAFVRYGHTPDSVVADKWIYRGNSLFAAYDTTQRFSEYYENGMYSYLPPWHVVGRYKAPGHRWWQQVFRRVREESPKPKHPLVGLLCRLPVDERAKHWHRLNALGAFDVARSV